MRAHEFITESQIDEAGLGTKLAGGALAATLGATAVPGMVSNLSKSPSEPVSTTQQVVAKSPTLNKTQTLIAKSAQKTTGIKTSTSDLNSKKHEKFLQQVATKAGIQGAELAQLLAQAAHETMDFKRMEENGSSSYFKQYEPGTRAGKILGNVESGDGERYKGRGYLQITGRYNYQKAGKALGLPLEEKPELLADPVNAAKAAIWYWQTRVQNKVSDFTNVKQSTKPINSGLKGLTQRQAKFDDYYKNVSYKK